MNDTIYDAIVIGGGPGGSTAALVMARAGLRVVVLEKDAHPRFHIGESILPRTTPLLQELGLSERIAKLPQVKKVGAEFGFGNDANTMKFGFTDGLLPGQQVFNIERAPFDKALADAAVEAGAELRENTAVREITKLTEGDVAVRTEAGDIRGRVLIDASGHGTVVGRHVGTRRLFNDPQLQKVAYFEHFEGVERLTGDFEGHPGIIMADEGWFWIISIDPTRTSVGFVTRPSFAKTIDVPADRMLQWAIARCPVVKHRMRDATGPATNRTIADFSYTCAPFAGDGYFLVGDAGCFLDPIFSSGVTLAMMSGQAAGEMTTKLLRGEIKPAAARRRYAGIVNQSTGVFRQFIRDYYKQSFRELFMDGAGPLQVHRAVISALAGQVFPKPVWAIRWRLWLFAAFVRLQQYVPLVKRRPGFSLLAAETADLAENALVPSPGMAGRGLG